MTHETPHINLEEDSLLAAEYVLGVQEAALRHDIEVRISRDPSFAALVKDWESLLSPMNSAYDLTPTPAHIKRDLMTRLFGEKAANSNGLWHSVKFWRGAAASALAVSLIAIGLSFVERQPVSTTDPLVAWLQAESGTVRFIAYYQIGNDVVRLLKLEAEKTADQDYELWLIEADGTPQSLGVLQDRPRSTVELSQEFIEKINAGDSFAISIEPLGGSPTGEVTGPVIASGISSRL